MKNLFRMLVIYGTVKLFGLIGLFAGLTVVYGGLWLWRKLSPAKTQPGLDTRAEVASTVDEG